MENDFDKGVGQISELTRLACETKDTQKRDEMWRLQLEISDMFRTSWQRELRRDTIKIVLAICSIIAVIVVRVILLEM